MIQEVHHGIGQAAEGTNHALNSTKDFHQVKILAGSRWFLISYLPMSYPGPSLFFLGSWGEYNSLGFKLEVMFDICSKKEHNIFICICSILSSSDRISV